jgi:hypothetical protein
MASYPYISGPNNIGQAITLLRKNFPATVTSDTIKKYGLASNNESYVINAIKFLGLIDEEGKRTPAALDVFSKHDDGEFQTAFASLVKNAYSDLFEIRGDDAWTLGQAGLVSYFRSADKTSDIIGGRQAGVFRIFAVLAGHAESKPSQPRSTAKAAAAKPKPAKPKSETKGLDIKAASPAGAGDGEGGRASKARDMALTVRIEVNLPAGATRQNYDDIFKSMKENLLND